jgi:periplasmic divalent cation tolerance protein
MKDSAEHPVLSVVTTLGSHEDAQLLARAILDQRLAACVQIEPGITSLYRWKGETCEDLEVRMTIKTLPGMAPALQALFHEQHPYELPQFLATVMAASPAYAQWVGDEVGAAPAG